MERVTSFTIRGVLAIGRWLFRCCRFVHGEQAAAARWRRLVRLHLLPQQTRTPRERRRPREQHVRCRLDALHVVFSLLPQQTRTPRERWRPRKQHLRRGLCVLYVALSLLAHECAKVSRTHLGVCRCRHPYIAVWQCWRRYLAARLGAIAA
jgi:hypothetical protein